MAMVGKVEEEYARSSIEQAKDFLRDGKYSKALHLLCRAERIFPHSQGVNELIAITEVCYAASWRCSCKLQYPKPKTPDWYRVLKVEETADVSVLKKRYRQLALLLHPDKNKNCKAEEAFKLVSEAYACLSDRGLRAAFSSERARTFCVRCSSSESMNRHERAHSKVEDQNEQPKCDQERLQEFRERARARVSKLTEDIKTRRSRMHADLETVREKYQTQSKRVDSKIWEEVLERPIRESDVFQPTTNQPRRRFQVADANLMSILRDRRNLQREKLISSQSLEGFLSKLKSDMRSSSVRHRDAATTSSLKPRTRSSQAVEKCNSFNSQQAEEPIAPRCSSMDEQQATRNSADGSGITNRFFSKRVSSVIDSFPAKKLFREDNGSDKDRTNNNADDDESSSDTAKCGSPEEDVRGCSYPIFERPSRAPSTCLRKSSMSEHLEPVHSTLPARPRTVTETEPDVRTPSASKSRANPIGDEEVSSSRRGTAQTVWTSGCCSKTTILKEQRQKSEELLKTLERLREEARSVAETLDKLKRGTEF